MHEVISRRFSDKNLEKWLKPDLILIDGGKGQVNAALNALEQKSIDIPLIGLAKRFETIIKPTDDGIEEVLLDKSSHVIKLLQRVRDESHRFAVSYHTNLKRKSGIASQLEEIPGVGPATKKKIINAFSSVRGLKVAKSEEIENALGKKTADLIKQYLN